MAQARKICLQCNNFTSWNVNFSRSIYISSCNFMPTKRKPVPYFPTSRQRYAQFEFKKHRFPEIVQSQHLRKPWDYPVRPDQSASWKHRRWYDELLYKWVDTAPYVDQRENFHINSKKQRKRIFEAETRRELFTMLLDHYKYKKYVVRSFDPCFPSRNVSYLQQYLTNTKYVHGLPHNIETSEIDDNYLVRLKNFVENLLLHQFNSNHYSDIDDDLKKKRVINENFMSSLMHFMTTTLSNKNKLLEDCELQYDAESSMFWLRGRGFLRWTIPDDNPVAYQNHNISFMQIRTKQKLSEFSPWLSDFSITGDIPEIDSTTHVYNVPLKLYRNTINTGYRLFAGDVYENYQYAMEQERLQDLPSPIYNQNKFGHTQVFLLNEDYSRKNYEANLEHCDFSEEIEEHLKGHGIMSGWTWTAAQAYYDGHWMDNDVTEPWCSQSIVTDGQWFAFYFYQLNTVAIDPENMEGIDGPKNNRRNLCYGTQNLKLFEEVTADGVVGLNEEVLRNLAKIIQNGYKTAAIDVEAVNAYDQSLPIQEFDQENPTLDAQQPLHKLQIEEKKSMETELLQKEEEKKKSYFVQLAKRAWDKL